MWAVVDAVIQEWGAMVIILEEAGAVEAIQKQFLE